MKRTLCVSLFTAATIAVGAPMLSAAVTAPAGYIYNTLLLGTVTQSCIAVGAGGTFVGVGRGFTANAGAIVLVKESGEARLVAFGFNSIGDCAYNPTTDVLYVTDNADNADLDITPSMIFGNTAAQSGDTVFAIPNASHTSARAATDLALLPANSIEFAANLALDASGNLFVANPVGGNAGTVLKITPGPVSATFLTGFDFTGSLAISPTTGHLFVAESLDSFAGNQLSEFTAVAAVVTSPLLGPSFAFGSADAAFNTDGKLLMTGVFLGDVVAVNPIGPSTTPFISGLNYANGITVNQFTGRVEVLSSFTGGAEDKSVHRFIPVTRLEPGRLSGERECLHEFYGIELVAAAPGEDPKKAICVDGAACDADGEVNDRCLFPVGSCFNVTDARLPECTPNGEITVVETSAGRDLRAFEDFDASIAAQLPIAGPSCAFSDGVMVKVVVKSDGTLKAGKGKIAVAVVNAAGDKDRDVINLVCQPAP